MTRIVIDIPDYDLQSVENGSIACGIILKAVKNGSILPEGHGDLKYIDAFKYWCETNEENGVITIPKFICDNIIKILDNAPTVIEADKENGND